MRFPIYILLLITFFGCSKPDNDNNNSNNQAPAFTTLTPTFNNGKIQFLGNVTSEGSGISSRGFCWGANTNPTLEGSNYQTADGTGLGNFFIDILYPTGIINGSTYNVRTFVYTAGGMVYGNNVSFTTPALFSVTSIGAKEIYTNQATLYANVISNNAYNNDVRIKGFCYGTSSNPTINDDTVLVQDGFLGDFSKTITQLLPNTTYHFRAFGYDVANQVFYGADKSFLTAGRIGSSGGNVFYDKGEVSDGWRYMELAPADIQYNNSYNIAWGCSGTAINQTLLTVGSGLNNTNRIVSLCATINNASRLCSDYSLNGLSDWFLPSVDELEIMYKSSINVYTLASSASQEIWSSSEYSPTSGYTYNAYYGYKTTESKGLGYRVRPVRRF